MTIQQKQITEIQKFIINYIEENKNTDVCDQNFHEQFYNKFDGKRKETNWGAQPVYKAMNWLKKLYEQNILSRGKVSLAGSWQPGFPKWVYAYRLKK